MRSRKSTWKVTLYTKNGDRVQKIVSALTPMSAGKIALRKLPAKERRGAKVHAITSR